jgi:uncharacterized membrane protein YidH (DUF202 family)
MRRPWPSARSALTVVGVALALVAIGAAAGAGPLGGHGRRTQEAAVDVGLVILCSGAVVIGLGAAMITRTGRSETRAARQSTPGASLGLALATILVVGGVALWTTVVPRGTPLGELTWRDPSGLDDGGGHAAGGFSPWFALGLLVLASISLGAGVLWLRRTLAERRTGGVGLAHAATQARRTLALPDDDRTAVLLAYARMEELLAGRRAVEAPREFLLRATAASGAQQRAAATRLTGLFERARFDRSPVAPADRAEADAALDVLGREP